MALLTDIIQEKCPKCSEGKIFNKKGNIFLLQLPKMNPTCPVCHHKFEKETGYFFGAMYVSYALTVAQMVAIFVIGLLLTDNYVYIITAIAILLVLLSTYNFRMSRVLWIYMLDGKNKNI